MEIARYPALGEEVEIGTLPYDFKGFIGSRNFCMKTKGGEMLAKANSIWTLLNFDSMKPALPPADMLEKYPVEPRLDMNYEGRKITVNDGDACEDPIVVQRQHLDSNNHVNNAQYIIMAIQYLPQDFEVRNLRVEYKKQAHLGDVLIPYVVTEGDKVVISLRDDTGAVYVNVECRKA